MHSCESCRGFVPEALTACPNCETNNMAKRGIKTKASVILSVSAISLTLMACYGAPPDEWEKECAPPNTNKDAAKIVGDVEPADEASHE